MEKIQEFSGGVEVRAGAGTACFGEYVSCMSGGETHGTCVVRYTTCKANY